MYKTEKFDASAFVPKRFESDHTIVLREQEIAYHTVCEDNVFYDEEGKAIAEEGKKLQDDLMNPMFSASAKAEAQKKMEDVQRRFLSAQQELRNAAQHFQSELADLETRLLKIETEEIREKINAYTKAKKFDIIADSTMLAFSNEALDVTDDILKAMKVDPAKRKEKAKDAKGDAKK